MTKDLTAFSGGLPFHGDYEAEAGRLGTALARLQLSQLVYRRRAIILFEGWEGMGKKVALRRLLGALDPCHVGLECVPDRAGGADERHWLARFWAALPAAGHTAFFFHSWYRGLSQRLLDGSLSDRLAVRAIDEINEFEAQQRDYDTIFIKLFFHAGRDRQSERLHERRDDPWHHSLYGEREVDSLVRRDAHEAVWNRLIAETDHRWAPWTLINAVTPQTGTIEAMRAVVSALETALPAEPPASTDTVVPLSFQRA